MSKKKLTYQELHRQLDYDPLTGIFRRKLRLSNRVQVGDIAGTKNKRSYIYILVCGESYLAHRLAWFYVYGYLPENDIDHKDRVKYHNWIDNLREASRSCNMRNTWNQKNNTSGIKGVSFDKRRDKWCAYIKVNKIKKFIGEYKKFDEAVCARLAGEQCLNWSGCDSSSPAYKYVNKMINGLL